MIFGIKLLLSRFDKYYNIMIINNNREIDTFAVIALVE